jgi:hypothetical protein
MGDSGGYSMGEGNGANIHPTGRCDLGAVVEPRNGLHVSGATTRGIHVGVLGRIEVFGGGAGSSIPGIKWGRRGGYERGWRNQRGVGGCW